MSRVRQIVLSAALLGCMAQVPPSPALAAGARGSPEDATRFIVRNLDFTSRPHTLDELRAKLRPRAELSREVRNAHVPGQVDRIVVLSGDGIEVELYVPASGPVLAQRIRVTTADISLPLGLRIGRSRLDDVYAALGEAAESETGPEGELGRRYYILERTASALLWFGRDERLKGVEWRFDVD